MAGGPPVEQNPQPKLVPGKRWRTKKSCRQIITLGKPLCSLFTSCSDNKLLFFAPNIGVKLLLSGKTDFCLIFQVPKLEFVLQRCPNLEHLTLSFGMRSVDVTQQEMESLSTSTSQRPLASLKSFTVHTYMTKRALEYLWTRAINLVRS